MTRIKAGTRVEIGLGLGKTEYGTVIAWRKVMGDRASIPGYHPIKFDTGTKGLMVHESGFRIIDNRPGRVVHG